jgi:GNAT superfamily N-acetyltransferase
VAAARRVPHSAVVTDLQITPVDPADPAVVLAYVGVRNAVSAVDAPWLHPMTLHSATCDLTYGWDGEPDTAYLATEDEVAVAAGTLSTTEWDNLHLAWLGVKVHPDHRRRGLGGLLLERLVADARARGRSSFGSDAWDRPGFAEFATAHGFEAKSRAINRRQVLADVDHGEVRRRHDQALAAAGDYEIVRRAGATPEAELEALAAMTASINDAPTDDLDIEDEVFTGERIRLYEEAQAARGDRLYRVFVRHRATGELAGHTVVVVDGERPAIGHQHDTSVVGSHRGHRLGLLLKADMNLWLREVEPQLETIDTWNAESNDHMIGVNELLGYRVLGREIEYQRTD